ncbi:MAG TPA: hypothetical protein VK070_01050 [Acidimicrobiia bacterium]|jgi:hypothetical protein|nr:hypothetical protein [Acidimicrobiia bacterium]
MVKVYAVVLVVGVFALIAWIVARAFAVNIDRDSIDPEQRFGIPGRRIVAAMVGFGMAGMSAEFSPLDISWPVASVLAVLGGAAAAWYAGWVGSDEDDADPAPETA